MYADDTYREHLSTAISALQAWAAENRDVADIEIDDADAYWKISVRPHAAGTCPFELLFDAKQNFSLALDREIYEHRPIDRFDFFAMLARAACDGRIERITTHNAMTAAADMIEMRVILEDGWAWVGERRVGPRPSRKLETAAISRIERYLPYRR